jgi:peptidyl-prolyl cis-trans isomerase SurA
MARRISEMRQRVNTIRMMWLFRFALAGLLLVFSAGMSAAQSIVVLVNDEPITSYDVAQRQRFLTLTSGFGDKVRARLQSEQTKEQFKAYMTKERPTSKEEAEALQKKFVANLQQEVLSASSGSLRKEAIDQLIDERLMLQAARDNKITVTDDEVNQTLTRMAEGGQRKLSLNEFLAQFNEQGVNPATLKARIRAQTAWRQVIRRVYGSRVQSSVSTVESVGENDKDAAAVDVRVVSLTMPAGAGQSAVAQRLLEADLIRQRFTSCDTLDAIVKGVQGASAKPLKSTKLSDFRGDVKAALQQAQPGQMTPPVIAGTAIESHALCAKKQTVAAGKNTEKKPDPNADKTQEEFQLYSKRHLKDLKDHARLDYPKSG